jgi:hypothetical protein
MKGDRPTTPTTKATTAAQKTVPLKLKNKTKSAAPLCFFLAAILVFCSDYFCMSVGLLACQ